MIGVGVDWNVSAYREALALFPANLGHATTAVVHRTAGEMAGAMQSHASGRPGPRVQSGDLRGSILVDHEIGDPDGFGAATVYTDVIYSRRLEYGFYGTDSLGRTFNQPPYPFFGPGFNQVAPDFIRDLQDVLSSF